MRVFCTDQHPSAYPYFKMFPHEYALPNDTVDIVAEKCEATISALFDAIIRCQDKDVGIVSHGTGSGLSIPLYKGSKSNFDDQALVCFRESLAQQTTDGDAAGRLNMHVGDYRKLLDQLKRLRDKRLGKVMFRACTIGEDIHTLDNFRQLLGCTSLCAPTTFDVFGYFQFVPVFKTTEQDWKSWKATHPSAEIFGQKPNRFSLDWSGLSPIQFKPQVESQKAVNDWVARKLPPGNYQGTTVYLTCVFPGTRLVFPRDSEYRNYLARSA
jgi:hypothetical protein